MKHLCIKFFSVILILSVINCSTQKDQSNLSKKRNRFHDKILQKIYTLQNQRREGQLTEFFKSNNPKYREAAALACASIQSPQSIMPLTALLSDENEAVASAAAYALGQIKKAESEDILLKSFSLQVSHQVKKDILEALGKCGTKKGFDFITNLKIKPNNRLLQNGQAWGIYRFALKNIYSEKGTQLILSLLLPSVPEEVRFIAANYLARVRNFNLQLSPKIIEAYKNEKSLRVKMPLLLALRDIQTPEVKSLIMKILNSSEPLDYRLKVNALRALATDNSDDIKQLCLKMLKHKNPNISVVASEYFLYSKTKLDAAKCFSAAKNILEWRTRANMLSCALKNARSIEDKNKISNWIIDLYKKSTHTYEKALLLKALSTDIDSFKFVETQIFKNVHENPAISSSGMESLVYMCKTIKDDKNMMKTFADIFERGIQSGDPVLVYFASNVFNDSNLKFREYFKNIELLNNTLKKLLLPKDLYAWREIQKQIALLKGLKDLPKEPELKNAPIDWKSVTEIAPDKQIRLMTSKGEITLQLMVNQSPGSVINFLNLIKDKSYKRFVFHRVAPNFVIQGGCPRGDGFGGPNYSIGSELGPLHYNKEGFVGMASAGKDTESSQWFITHSPAPHLDGSYTIFAKIIAGMDVVHQIEIGDVVHKFKEVNIP